MNDLQWVKKVASSPAFIVLGFSFLCLVISLLLTQQTWVYNSDDVSWQSILLTWQPFNGHVVYLGYKDNFITNVPFFVLLGHFFAPGRGLLIAEAILFRLINFALFITASLYFLRRCQVRITYGSLLPFLWLASFGSNFEQLFLNTNWRDFEEGVAFIYFMIVAKFYYGELDPLRSWLSRCMSVLLCLIAGIFMFSDPYFTYFVIVPILMLFLALYLLGRVDRKQLLVILCGGLLSFLFERATEYAMKKIHLLTPPGSGIGFAGFHRLLPNLWLAVRGIAIIFGANFTHAHLFALDNLPVFCNFAILLIIGYCFYRSIPSRRRLSRKDTAASLKLWSGFLVALSALALLVYVVSSTETDILTYRYLIVIVYALTLLLSLQSARLTWGRPLIIGLFIAATVLNLISSYSGAKGVATNSLNADNYTLIRTIKGLGVTKGYTDYWEGNINTYFADGSVKFLPVTCSNNQTVPLLLLTGATLYNIRTAKSFYMVDPDAGSPTLCSEQEVIEQFGKPARTVHVLDKTILVYDYDIGTKL